MRQKINNTQDITNWLSYILLYPYLRGYIISL